MDQPPVSPKQTFTYAPEGEGGPVFTYRTLNRAERRRMHELLLGGGSARAAARAEPGPRPVVGADEVDVGFDMGAIARIAFDACQLGLVGWEHFRDGAGQLRPWPGEIDAAMEMLPDSLIEVVGLKIWNQSRLGVRAKN